MAVDTADKRASALGTWDAVALPVPSAVVATYDRPHLLGLYRLGDAGDYAPRVTLTRRPAFRLVKKI
jgi:hypothetical protein